MYYKIKNFNTSEFVAFVSPLTIPVSASLSTMYYAQIIFKTLPTKIKPFVAKKWVGGAYPAPRSLMTSMS